jgi:hypothetical protein
MFEGNAHYLSANPVGALKSSSNAAKVAQKGWLWNLILDELLQTNYPYLVQRSFRQDKKVCSVANPYNDPPG